MLAKLRAAVDSIGQSVSSHALSQGIVLPPSEVKADDASQASAGGKPGSKGAAPPPPADDASLSDVDADLDDLVPPSDDLGAFHRDVLVGLAGGVAADLLAFSVLLPARLVPARPPAPPCAPRTPPLAATSSGRPTSPAAG